MPSKSKKQARLMAAVAHNPRFAKKVDIPQSVGRDFYAADRRAGRYGEGGSVLPSSTDDDEDWTDTYIKRPLSGLASMWGGTDLETGEFVSPALHNLQRAWGADERRRQGLPPKQRATLGIVDEAVSLPALGEVVGLPAPQFAKDAEERASTTREAARDTLDLDDPHGFAENVAESAGVMAGQLPVPASLTNRLRLLKQGSKLGKVTGPAVEWFSPTVVPKASNYLKGTLFGGGMGGALDYLEDHLSERDRQEQQKEWIAEAMAEVLAEEQGGDETTDDEALADLGYAEGGRVKNAKRMIGSLRSILAETDPEDAAARKAKIDQALHALKGTTGPSEMDRVQLHTSSMGLSDAAADPHPARRRQRFGDYERNVLDLLEGRVAPSLMDRPAAHVPRVISNLPAPVSPRSLPTGQGRLSQEEFERTVLKKQAFAEGGQVDPRGTPLSQGWFENYGSGPEHLFLGDRTVKLHDMWGPQRPGAVPDTSRRPGGSLLPAAGILGFAAYDAWKNRRGAGQDASQNAFWQDMHNSAANTKDTDAWVNRQLEQYGANMPMPQINPDGSTYSVPGPGRDFWQNIHDSASNTADTDAWVNQQLDEYGKNMEMPTAEYDVQPGLLDRAWQGGQGALGIVGGLEQGGVGGAGRVIQGAGNLYGSVAGPSSVSNMMGRAGGTLGGLGSIYSGIQEGGVRGYTQAASGALQTANALGYTGGAAGAALGKAVPLVGAALSAYGAYESAKVGDKKGAISQGASAGAAIGSVVPVIGTVVGAAIGAIVGLVGASFGNKENPSELAYGAHKKLKPEEQIRGWTRDQVGGAVFETIKSHTKSGNVNRFKDVAEMYTAFGITKDAHKNYKNVQSQMNDFIKGVVTTAQQMGALPTDPAALKQLDGQQIYYKVVVPAMAAKFKEATGKESTGWNKDFSKEKDAKMQNLFADWTDWMTSHWGEDDLYKKPAPAKAKGLAGAVQAARAGRHAHGGVVRTPNMWDYNPRSGALALVN